MSAIKFAAELVILFAQLLPYTTEHGLGRMIGGMYFHVREGEGTDEALKWDKVMSQADESAPAKPRERRGK